MVSAVLTAAMLICVSGCGSKNDSSGGSESTVSTVPSSPDRPGEMNITSAADVVKQMRIGWNLGNTLDATGGEGLTAETSWGCPVTTKEMIDKIKGAGFNVLRVPVSWGTHLDEEGNIDKAWLDRVQEVVNYGIDNDMFVILNTHHEEWYMPTKDHVESDLKTLEKLWQQIAERFKDYGDKLMFEGLNEPRLRGQGAEWTGNKSAREIVNQYEETFVKTVRATGGNNEQRILFISPYAASSTRENLSAVKIPENAGNVIVSVHAYLPYDFALNVKGSVFYENDGSIDTLMDNIQSIFLDKGIPVVITEFGCMNKGNSEERLKCITDYLTAANKKGVPCIWWDNNSRVTTSESFGLLNRENNTWYFPEIIDKINEIMGE